MTTRADQQRRRFDQAMRQATAKRERTWDLPPHAPSGSHEGNQLSDVFQSKDEGRLRDFLVAAGLKVERRSFNVPNIIEGDGTWCIRPDMVVGNVAIEVDSPAERGGGPSHVADFPAEDLYRGDCFRAIGKVVLHVRLNGLEPVPDASNVCRAGSLTVKVMGEVLNELVKSLIVV